MPVILLCNDDGIHSQGLNVLAEALRDLGRVYVVAPDRDQSATSHSLTLDRPLKLRRIADGDGREARYVVNGTPTDSVILGVESVLKGRKPDLLVSGINLGQNMGEDISYSGTVSAAMEGMLLGIPSFAISLSMHGPGMYLQSAARIARGLSERVLSKGLPVDTLLNVNVPNRPWEEIKGVRITHQGRRRYENIVSEMRDPRGHPVYWIGGEANHEQIPGADFTALSEGYISVTPVHLNLTNYAAVDDLQSWFER